MKDILFLLFLVLISSVSPAQELSKKVLWYDVNGNLVEKETFKKIMKQGRYTYTFLENDSAYIGKMLHFEEFGRISLEERKTLIAYLRKLADFDGDGSVNIVINFYFEPQKQDHMGCIDHYTSDRKYRRYFKKSTKDVQFFITEKGYTYRRRHVFEDIDNVIRPLFFTYFLDCGNYVILRPNGDFLLRRGEYRQDEIPKKIYAEWKAKE